MQSEFEGRINTGTFLIAGKVPKRRKPVGSKWCFDYKTDKEGNITNFKARLTARGYMQIRNMDFTHSSSPCPPSASIELVLVVANKQGLSLYNFEATQPYIRASLDEDIYMKLPGGCGEKSKSTAKL